MEDFFTIDLSYNNYHLVFPRIIIVLIIVLGLVILVTNLLKKFKGKEAEKFEFKFFKENYDKLKFFGSIILLIIYGFTLNLIGFIPATITFVVLNTLLYIGNIQKKSFMISIANSLGTTLVIWFVFGHLFDITLP